MAGLNVVKNVLDCLKLKYVLTERVFWSNVKSYTGTRRHTCKQGGKGVSSVAERNYWKWKLCLTLSIGDKTNTRQPGHCRWHKPAEGQRWSCVCDCPRKQRFFSPSSLHQGFHRSPIPGHTGSL